MEWLMWSQMREERAEARRRSEARDERDRLRQEADAAAQRDREFLKEVVNRAAPAAAAAPAVDISRELSLFERRMELNLQKHQLEVTQKLLNQQLADANNDDGASSLSEAANNAGVQAVEEIGEALPEIVAAGLGKLKRWMAANGQEPTRENMLGAIEALKAALSNGEEEQPNGAAHAEDD
jgi:hypothetical protein